MPSDHTSFYVDRSTPPLAQAASLTLGICTYLKVKSWGQVAEKIAADDSKTMLRLAEMHITAEDSALLDHFGPILRLLRTSPRITFAVCPECGPPGPSKKSDLAGGDPSILLGLKPMSRIGRDGDGPDWLDFDRDNDPIALLAALEAHLNGPEDEARHDGYQPDGTWSIGTGWTLVNSDSYLPSSCRTTWLCPGREPVRALRAKCLITPKKAEPKPVTAEAVSRSRQHSASEALPMIDDWLGLS